MYSGDSQTSKLSMGEKGYKIEPCLPMKTLGILRADMGAVKKQSRRDNNESMYLCGTWRMHRSHTRYLLSSIPFKGSLPLVMTFLINIVGAFLIGAVVDC